MEPINLIPFCSKDETRSYIMAPFSRGEFTWATNGHILVRVARRDDIPESSNAPKAEKVLFGLETAEYSPLPNIKKWPKPPKNETCFRCDGSRTAHACPDCTCECPKCDGTGYEIKAVSVGVRGVNFNLKYIRMICGLPHCEFVNVPKGDLHPALFKFDGGVGAVMPMRGQAINHVGDIEGLV